MLVFVFQYSTKANLLGFFIINFVFERDKDIVLISLVNLYVSLFSRGYDLRIS